METTHFCFECQTHQPDSEMIMKEDCSCCGGRKCKIHQRYKHYICDRCGQEGLCIDCTDFCRCCMTPEEVLASNSRLK